MCVCVSRAGQTQREGGGGREGGREREGEGGRAGDALLRCGTNVNNNFLCK